MHPVTKTFEFGGRKVTLETGRVARQADGAVLATMDNTVVLATVVGARTAKADQDFFPLSVHYQEKAYAAGKIPGGFMKREGRPSEKETLTSRLIDRPVRPLFPQGFRNEVQVITTVLSADKETDPDILAMLATSAALSVSGVPFAGPIGAARVGFNEDKGGYVLNPSVAELKESELDMVVAGTGDAVLMVESQAFELTEDEMIGAILFGHQEYQGAIAAIAEFAAEVGKPQWSWTPEESDTAALDALREQFTGRIADAYAIKEKQQRTDVLQQLRSAAVGALQELPEQKTLALFGKLEKELVRKNIMDGQPRIDGRDTQTVRPLHIEVGVLPKVHGSALFTRGETQALVTTTLGAVRDAQLVEGLTGEKRDQFMLHYNFPPFSVGECGRIGTPGRREIGHGRLARRGLAALLPNDEEFPYTVRVVSEITESNGSSSMASVCGASLALMDAGAPLKAPVAGIAMGLIKEGERFSVLTDILGDEDHLGDMDFKVAGTSEGVTALQMDMKIQGITEDIMEMALEQAMQARLTILEQMNRVIAAPRDHLHESAPMTMQIKIHPDKIRDVIGKGGSTIRSICDKTGATVDIDDSGDVKIYGQDKATCEAACEIVKSITAEAEVGKIYEGTVVRIADFGAFVNILPGRDGLVHISEIAFERVNAVSDYLEVGQSVKVRVSGVDKQGRIKLTMKMQDAAQ